MWMEVEIWTILTRPRDFFKNFWLDYSWFTMLHSCQVYSKMNQWYIYIYPLKKFFSVSTLSLQHAKHSSLCYTVCPYSFSILYIVVLSVSHSVMCKILRPHELYSLPGFSVHGILQARILEQVAIPFSRGSSQYRDWTWVSSNAGRFFTLWATREAPHCAYVSVPVSQFVPPVPPYPLVTLFVFCIC